MAYINGTDLTNQTLASPETKTKQKQNIATECHSEIFLWLDENSQPNFTPHLRL